MATSFKTPPESKSELEADGDFTPKFDQNGLLTAVVTNVETGKILMLAHMNAQALQLTIETGIAHYYSRSRQSLWKKGETSGNLQFVQEIRTDCDQDAVILDVKMTGDKTACHTGRVSCFYRKVTHDDQGNIKLVSDQHS